MSDVNQLITKLIVPAKSGRSVRLKEGDVVQIINDAGTQVVDLWAIALEGEFEYLSMEHCREVLGKVYFEPGDTLISNRYASLLEYVSDTTDGRHDTLIAACSEQMYVRFGRGPGHPSCASNLIGNTRDVQWLDHFVPQPWNLFMRAAVKSDGSIEYSRPPFMPGATVELKVLRDGTY
ncbi:MAG: hypothetical protein PPHEMADM_5563 [uncultured Paraburkholderia sp.]|nr:MAG: hypothetical protein PPHEMADE_5585 [uncultured Paraburkholderia sp.]CAH2945440.1 MAG: hypothetical protein PPHEMADM_5563 [uncultured Paraburkholderia sp.]